MMAEQANPAGAKLLIVEDERLIASFLTKGLKRAGYAVEHVLTGEEALARARGTSTDLIILDLGLPDIDGLEVLRRLRQSGDEVPVIILTARDETTSKVEGLDLGADDYMTKPFALEELIARVRNRLRRRKHRSAV